MTKGEAVTWLREKFGVEPLERLEAFVALLIEENARQNLIAASTLPTLWVRHIVDSAQLVTHAPPKGTWFDVGTGPGLPGVVVAIVSQRPLTLIEPRRRRVEFLQQCVERLSLDRTSIISKKVEAATGTALVISARAVAPVEKLLTMAGHLSSPSTTWILPRGQSSAEDRAALQRYKMAFHVEQSMSDPGSEILIARGRPQ